MPVPRDQGSDEFVAAVTGVGALVDPVRRELYLYAASQQQAVTREQAAAACGVAVHSAKFHLDRLVEQGLLEVDHRRVSGRTGPGAGRPAKVYRRTDRELAVTLPGRAYDVAADLMARALEQAAAGGISVAEAVERVAREHGTALAATAVDAPGAERPAADRPGTRDDELRDVSAVLDGEGYEPFLADDAEPAELCLRNCPFDRLAREHTALVCGMNLALVDGVTTGLGCTRVAASLHPDAELCCVRVR
jgi:predicted ArsR family transcriptional regulator